MSGAEDALCDALLMEVGLRNLIGESRGELPIEVARNLVRPWAQGIRRSLREDGLEVAPATLVAVPSGMPNQTQTEATDF